MILISRRIVTFDPAKTKYLHNLLLNQFELCHRVPEQDSDSRKDEEMAVRFLIVHTLDGGDEGISAQLLLVSCLNLDGEVTVDLLKVSLVDADLSTLKTRKIKSEK
tara:strand:- start:146 stop:463 length:318 start_codon:yes stop_codon:yes gene_type:complete